MKPKPTTCPDCNTVPIITRLHLRTAYVCGLYTTTEPMTFYDQRGPMDVLGGETRWFPAGTQAKPLAVDDGGASILVRVERAGKSWFTWVHAED